MPRAQVAAKSRRTTSDRRDAPDHVPGDHNSVAGLPAPQLGSFSLLSLWPRSDLLQLPGIC